MSPCQGEGRGFDSRLALSKIKKKPDLYRLLFFKKIPFIIQLSEYVTLKEKAENTPMNTFIKKALNA